MKREINLAGRVKEGAINLFTEFVQKGGWGDSPQSAICFLLHNFLQGGGDPQSVNLKSLKQWAKNIGLIGHEMLLMAISHL